LGSGGGASPLYAAISFRESCRGHLWQGHFTSFALDERYLMPAVHYGELNPAHARLRRAPWRWPWSSAAAHVAITDNIARLRCVRSGILPSFHRCADDPSRRKRRTRAENTTPALFRAAAREPCENACMGRQPALQSALCLVPVLSPSGRSAFSQKARLGSADSSSTQSIISD